MSIPRRVTFSDNRPDPQYRPKNLSNFEYLPDHYVIASPEVMEMEPEPEPALAVANG